jgi:hypothetical protein
MSGNTKDEITDNRIEPPSQKDSEFIENAKRFIAANGIAEQAGTFTAYAAEIFAQELPDAKISIAHPLVLRIAKGEFSSSLSLINFYDYAARNPADSEARLRWVADSLAKTRTEAFELGALDKSQIRAVVRATASPHGISRPIAGGLHMVCVAEGERLLIDLTADHAVALSLSEDEVIALAEQNTAAILKPLPDNIPPDRLGSLEGDEYASSWFLLHDAWARLSEQAHGNLIVAMPTADRVCFCDGRIRAARETIVRAAMEVTMRAEEPLTRALFKWTPGGWEVVDNPASRPHCDPVMTRKERRAHRAKARASAKRAGSQIGMVPVPNHHPSYRKMLPGIVKALEAEPPLDDDAFDRRAMACFLVMCSELAQIKDIKRRTEILSKLQESAIAQVGKVRLTMVDVESMAADHGMSVSELMQKVAPSGTESPPGNPTTN